jgi:hypothetical protein
MIVYDKQVSFLRFKVDDGTRMRNHPHVNKKVAYLDSALFAESYYPEVKTSCYQKDQTLIAFRSINHLRNKVKSIHDSLDVQRFDGKVFEYNTNQRKWICLIYEQAVICITSLQGIKSRFQGENEMMQLIDCKASDHDISINQWLYQDELQTLFDDRIYAGWVIHMIDQKLSEDELKTYLNNMTIEDQYVHDTETPRQSEWYKQEVNVLYKKQLLVSCIHDPYL